MHAEEIISTAALNQVYRIVINYTNNTDIDFETVIAKIETFSKSSKPETSNLSMNFLKNIR
jgi:hypothetical protein